MDFFTEQELAKKRSRRLLVLFGLSVLGVVVVSCLAFAGVALLVESLALPSETLMYGAPRPWMRWELFAGIALFVTTTILGGSAFKLLTTRSGGEGVARTLGGRRVPADTIDLGERRLLNVVEEMAIASGISVPDVFVLDEEAGINAFAAGPAPSEAVIGVTRGAIESLNRDELQGVIAHEFSHVLNGDMRLNIRLIALVHGLLVVALAGRIILYSVSGRRGRFRTRSSRRGGGKEIVIVLLVGAVLWLVGSIGAFFGRLIKAAVSRQREFLADAAAVEFTRNPLGIGGALTKLLNANEKMYLRSVHAEEVSHMLFFGSSGGFLASLLASHPPLRERVARIGGAPAKLATHAPSRPRSEPVAQQTSPSRGMQGAMPLAGSLSGGSHTAFAGVNSSQLAFAEALHASLPLSLLQAVRRPELASATLVALALGSNPAGTTTAATPSWIDAEAVEQARTQVVHLPVSHKFPLVQIALPAIRRLHKPQASELLAYLQSTIEADGKVSLLELGVFSLVRISLLHDSKAPVREGEASLDEVLPHAEIILSAFAWLGTGQESPAKESLEKALVAQREEERTAGKLSQVPTFKLRPTSEITLARFGTAIDSLRGGSLDSKRVLLEVAAKIALFDGHVCSRETELFRVIGACLECPIPISV